MKRVIEWLVEPAISRVGGLGFLLVFVLIVIIRYDTRDDDFAVRVVAFLPVVAGMGLGFWLTDFARRRLAISHKATGE